MSELTRPPPADHVVAVIPITPRERKNLSSDTQTDTQNSIWENLNWHGYASFQFHLLTTSSVSGIWVPISYLISADIAGLAMADNLQKYLEKEGYPPLLVYNRTPSRADSIKDKHVKVVETVEDAVKPSDIIFSCVPTFNLLCSNQI